MHVTDITLRHYRNLAAVDWQPAAGLNLLWGENGQGKTNLLEGLHMALTGRSFRTRRDEELLPWGREDEPADPSLAQAIIAREEGERRLRVTLGKGWKRAFADAQWLARLGDLLGEAAVVTFTPEDASLFRGAPAGRRRLLDMVLSQLSPAYLWELQQHARALRQLAAAYKLRGPEKEAREAAAAFAPIVAQTGAAVMAHRAARLGEAGTALSERFKALGGEGELTLQYDHDLKRMNGGALAEAAGNPASAEARVALAEAYLGRLEQGFDEARRTGAVPTGAHRDDFAVALDGRDLRRFGSQGQHRLGALALKLETARWLRQARGEAPILLLDDFGSELDRTRRGAVLDELRGSMQVFITATDRADLAPAAFDKSVRVAQGRVEAQ